MSAKNHPFSLFNINVLVCIVNHNFFKINSKV
nr:MAG TPA: HNF3 C-terminal domain [Caudoviricetes sp.]